MTIELAEIADGDQIQIQNGKQRLTGPAAVQRDRSICLMAFGTAIPIAYYRMPLQRWVPAKGVEVVWHQPAMIR